MDAIENAKEMIGDVFGMDIKQAHYVEKLIKENNFSNLLELGFAHGVSSCYMGTILKEQGKGHLTTIDRVTAKNRQPNIEELLNKLDLTEYVTPCYENKSYNWKLMELLEENEEPIFDFCYIDGAHDWYDDALAFCLVDKLLKPGGIVLFDDYGWTYASSPSLKDTDRVKKMSEKEKTTPHIKLVYNLLVKRNPNYHNFKIIDDWWALAQKKK